MNIRPVSDLRNKYPEVEKDLEKTGMVYLTKNGYGTAVLFGLNKYKELYGDLEPTAEPPHPVDHKRGFLHEYANAEKAKREKDAGRIHAKEKYTR